MATARSWSSASILGLVIGVVVLALVGSGVPASAATGQGRDGGPGPAVPVGSSTQTITVGGVVTTYVLDRPASVSGRSAVPLVVMLHGGFGQRPQAEKDYGWNAEAEGRPLRGGLPGAGSTGPGTSVEVAAESRGRPT